ncbi:MAG: prepilin peptidase [Angustibacter sp.]
MIALAGVCALLGLIVGSFLNVVIWRVPRGESVVTPPSRCPGCQQLIRPWDNVPVLGWLVLRGWCRQCRAPISARYPAVELATGLLFAAIAWRFGATWELPAYLYLGAIGIALTMIDIDVHRLPDVIVKPSYVVLPALLLIPAATGGRWGDLLRAVVGGAAMYGFFLMLKVIKPEGMGWGDIKLAGVLGAGLGWLGWGALAVGTFAGFLSGGLYSGVLWAAGLATRKSRIPYGPFLIGGAMLGVFWGQRLFDAYLRLSTA